MLPTRLDAPLKARMGLAPDAPAPVPAVVRGWQFSMVRLGLARAADAGPFFAERYGRANPLVLRGPSDMAALPRTTAEDLREAPERMLCTSRDAVERAVTLHSSGSTGRPKRLFFTAGDLERTTDFFHHGMAHMAGPGETVLALLPASRQAGVGPLLAEGVRRLGARCETCDRPWDVPAALERLEATGATALVGAPAHVGALAALRALRGLPPSSVRTVLFCWDAAPAGAAERVRAALGCGVLRHWGMTETGLGGAVECAPGSGMHLREADLYVEICDPDTGAPLPDGQWGEITVTTLTRRAMPLIRYRTGDLGRILPGPCPCGSPQRRLDAVPGRLDGGEALPGGGTLSRTDLDAALLAVPGVLDCDARLGGDPPGLRLTLFLPPGGDGNHEHVMCAARQAALDLPDLGRAVRSGALGLDLALGAADGTIVPGFAKRGLGPKHEDGP